MKFKSNYIVGFLLGLFGIGFPFLIFFLLKIYTSEPPFMYPILMASIALGYLLLGVFLGDLPVIIFKIKHRDEYDPAIPEEVKEKGLRFRIPLFMGCVFTFIALGLLALIYFASGKVWPLL